MNRYAILDFGDGKALIKYKKSSHMDEDSDWLTDLEIIKSNTAFYIGPWIIATRKDGDCLFEAKNDVEAKLIYEVGGYE